VLHTQGNAMDYRGSKWMRSAIIAVAALAGLATLWFGMRSYRTLVLLNSAYELGAPQAGTIRAWMTLRYIASSYRIPQDRLLARLELPPTGTLDVSLRSIAERRGESPFAYVQQVQRSIADIVPPAPPSQAGASQGWLDWANDLILAALLRYGYAILALTLLLGAIGLPAPTGLAAAVAGSLAATGRVDWLAAGAVAVAASVAGDAIAYALGRGVSEQFLARRGRWFGFTAHRQAHARALFARWGALTVLVTRTLVSHLSSVVSLLAGISRYRLAAFLAVALFGRALWTAAYMGLGYGIGGNLEYATDFLKSLSGLLISLSILVAASVMAAGRVRLRRPSRQSE
jgi:membrane protein DedA with SNARE-associated domain